MRKLFAIALAALLVVAFSASAFAYDVKLGARINQEFGWDFKSKERTNNKNDDVTTSFNSLVGNSYLNAKFMSEDKKVGAFIEIGMKEYSNIGTRYAYAWYKVGNCTLSAGQFDNWQGGKGVYWTSQKLAQGASTGDVLGYGKAWVPRQPKIEFMYQAGAFGFSFALEKPNTVATTYSVPSTVDVYNKIPGLSIAADYTSQVFEITPAFIWTRWDMEGMPSGYDETVDSMGFILPIAVKMGGFKLILEGHYAKNPAGVYSNYSTYGKAVFKNSGKVEDTDLVGGYGELSYVTGALRIAVGAGVESYTNDAWKAKDGLGYKEDNVVQYMGWIALPYEVHKYLTIRPELNYFSFGDNPKDGKDGGNEWLIGVLFRFVF